MRKILSVISIVLLGPLTVLLTIIVIPIALIPFIFGRNAGWRFSQFLYSLWSKLFLWCTLSRVRIHGKENIPKNGNYVIFPNHSSFFDIPVLTGFVAPNAAYVARKNLISWGTIGIWILLAGGVLIEQKRSRKELILFKRIIERVERGLPIIIFPEGTRCKNNKLGRLKKTTLRIPQRAGASIVPVRLEGTTELLPRGSSWPRPADIEVFIGKPIEWKRMKDNSDSVLTDLENFYRESKFYVKHNSRENSG